MCSSSLLELRSRIVLLRYSVGISQVHNGVLYIKYRNNSKITIAEWCKTLTHVDGNPSYSTVQYTSRGPLILLTVEKIDSEKFKFVVLLYIQNICTPNDCCTITDVPFWVRAPWELWLQTCIAVSFEYAIWCVLTFIT